MSLLHLILLLRHQYLILNLSRLKLIKLGSSNAICNISFLFFSPPEKPTFNCLLNISSSIFSSVDFSLRIFKNSIALSSDFPLAFLMEFREVLKKFLVNTPGISVGYCKANKHLLELFLL